MVRASHRSRTAGDRRVARSPLDGTSQLIVDGTNLLYRLGSGGAAPPAAIIGRIRAAIPGAIAIDLVFDGLGQGVSGRLAQGMYVRYSGRRPADDVILDLVSEAVMAAAGPAAGSSVLVVTNDRELRDRLAAKGARTVPAQWLLSRLELPKLAAPAAGNRRPPRSSGVGAGDRSAAGSDEDDDLPRWKPGRGATTKKGPARRVARHKRHPRPGG